MGLDCSYDAFHGAYSAFNRLRKEVCRATGGSFPPHYIVDENGQYILEPKTGLPKHNPDMNENRWYFGDGYSNATHPGLTEFFCHSDCDGEIAPDLCLKVADELETLLPKITTNSAGGHLDRDGGFRAVVQRFINGCREAAAAGEPLEFG